MTGLLVRLVTGVASAADSIKSGEIILRLPGSITGVGEEGFEKLWASAFRILFAFLALMAFVGIIYSGIMMITSDGDATKFAAGKKNLIWSIIGIVIVVLAYFVIRFIYSLTGVISQPPTTP